MSVLNVLNTNTINASGELYIRVNTGIYRVSATSASSIQFNNGPAITLLAGESVLLKGSNPGRAGITNATADVNAVYTLGDGNVGLTGNTHPFSVGDYIETCAPYSGIIGIEFESPAYAGRVVVATTSNTITTDIDSSSATADYVYAGGPQGHVHRCVKITAGAADIVVEEVQIVGG